MRNRLRRALVLMGLGPAALFFQAGCSVPSEKFEMTTADKRERDYRLYVPATLPQGPRPLVVALHGRGGTGRQMERSVEFDALADKDGFLVAYPSGLDRCWNDGREAEGVPSQADHVDDGAFVVAMIEEISRQHAVDPARVFATGISNGGFFTHYLANRFPERFAAIAPVVGGIAAPVAEHFGTGPVAVLIFQGTEDPLVPYGGGEVGKNRGRMIDTVAAAKLWAQRNGCTADSGIIDEPDRDQDDACHVQRREWTGGEAPVILRTIVGGGHTWPGGSQYLPKVIIGRVCRDLDATNDIWEFFKAHPRK